MKKGRGYLILQAAVCILLFLLLAGLTIWTFCEGSARRAENPLESIYTPETTAERFLYAAPLLAAAAVLRAFGLARGIRDEREESPVKPDGPVKHSAEPKGRRVVRAVLLAAALILILTGILNGSARDVLIKAITICTECVGLG